MKIPIPDRTDSAAVYLDPSVDLVKSIKRQYTRISRFDEPFNMWAKTKSGILLPRNSVPRGEDHRDAGADVNFTSNFKARNSEQVRLIKSALRILETDQDFIFQAPTGFGKTYCSMPIIAGLGKRTCVITTKEDIVDQWVLAIREILGLSTDEIGIWRANKVPEPHHKIVVGLVQSLMNGPERYGVAAYMGYGLVMVDEVHRMGADEFSKAMWWFPAQNRVGMSATPHRRDGKDAVFHAHIGPVRIVIDDEKEIPRVIMKQSTWKVPIVMRGGKHVRMPHKPGRVMQLMRYLEGDAIRNAMITKFVKDAYDAGRHNIIFSDTVSHPQVLHKEFVDAGINPQDIGYYMGLDSGVYHSKGAAAKKQEREKAKVKPVLFATYKMASEATDIPWLDTCTLVSPRADVAQIVGRIRREFEGKKHGLVFDVVDKDSRVFHHYAMSREKWYNQLGCKVSHY